MPRDRVGPGGARVLRQGEGLIRHPGHDPARADGVAADAVGAVIEMVVEMRPALRIITRQENLSASHNTRLNRTAS